MDAFVAKYWRALHPERSDAPQREQETSPHRVCAALARRLGCLLVSYMPLALALFQGFSRDRNARTFISRVSVAGFLSE